MRIEDIKTIQDFVKSPIFFLWSMTHDDEEIHHCYGCELIQEELKKRIEKDTDQCAYTKFEHFIEDIREMCDHCWCPKYSGKTWVVLENRRAEKEDAD